MNREIKFRAWDFNKNEMLFFEGIFNKSPYTEKSTFLQYESIPEYHKLDLMQYTGLKDINGVEIYEGDIFSHTYYEGRYMNQFEEAQMRNEPIKVYSGLKLSFKWHTQGENTDIKEVKIPSFYRYLFAKKKYFCYKKIQHVCDHLAIIGNKFENPELLEKTDAI